MTDLEPCFLTDEEMKKSYKRIVILMFCETAIRMCDGYTPEIYEWKSQTVEIIKTDDDDCIQIFVEAKKHREKVVDILKSPKMQTLLNNSKMIDILHEKMLFVIDIMPSVEHIMLPRELKSYSSPEFITPITKKISLYAPPEPKNLGIFFEKMHAYTKYLMIVVFSDVMLFASYYREIDFSNLPPTVIGVTFFLDHYVDECKIDRITKEIFSRNTFSAAFKGFEILQKFSRKLLIYDSEGNRKKS